jgi:translation initiation factor 1
MSKTFENKIVFIFFGILTTFSSFRNFSYLYALYFWIMADNDWKARLGMVYSTNPDFEYRREEHTERATLPEGKQNLRVSLDRKRRGGKQVTLVTGFVGAADDLAALGKTLKTRLGVGGAAKDGEIIVQGDFRDRVVELLLSLGYTKTKKS